MRTRVPARHPHRRVRRAVLVCLSFITIAAAAYLQASRNSQAAAQKQEVSTGPVWQEIDERSIPGGAVRAIVPQRYRVFRLNTDALTGQLKQAQMEFTEAANKNPVVLALPMPDGSLSRFQIVESPMMEPGLAAKVPRVRNYSGQGIDDRTATTRFDWMPTGFHAIVLSASGSVYIDPYAKDDTTHYISYFKRDYHRDAERFRCMVTGSNSSDSKSTSLGLSSGGTMRIYRLALAATQQYTNAFCQPEDDNFLKKFKAFFAMNTTMNRVNAIFERDLGIHMIFVTQDFDIIFTQEPDGYSNGDPSAMLAENQSTIDTVIEDANYDIGHVFGTNSGGVSCCIGSVCTSGIKAQGVSANGVIQGDPFDVDYVCHEMGHQFGANHTFNGTSGDNCGGQRVSGAAYEPGTGSTIMGYAAICSPQDLQPNSNDYFHVKSLEEIIAFVNGLACDTENPISNNPPSVDAGPLYRIPKSTPFTLTATGSDPDGDALTYCWEEYDLGPQSPPDDDSDGLARPIFRSYLPETGPARTFPRLTYILNNANVPPTNYACNLQSGTCLTGEVLPSIARTMRFQVTARDNRSEAGGIATDFVDIEVKNTSGPFVVTQPNAGVSWEAGSTQTITWSVANTDVAPVSCANVKISLSTDGGNGFSYILVPSTPNDGAETVQLPQLTTPAARIKVEAVGNIFFDVSDVDFSLTMPAVTTMDDGGQGSLRFAIGAANGSPDTNTINFNIPGSGVRTINLTSPLPEITNPVVFDGTSQPGYAGTPIVELNGASAGPLAHGLQISGGNSTVKGLIINRFDGSGVFIVTNGGNLLYGNYIGTDATGMLDRGNQSAGITISNSPYNRIGLTLHDEFRNVISGNGTSSTGAPGIRITGVISTGNEVVNNYLGVNVTGLGALGNSYAGVEISGAADNIIGGPLVGDVNVISGNDRYGVAINNPGSTGNTVQNNLIGTNKSGTAALGNFEYGVFVFAASTNALVRNTISANGHNPTGGGILINQASNNVVQGNHIGTNAAGGSPLGNIGPGIEIVNSSGNDIGGASPFLANVICASGGGVLLADGVHISTFSNNNRVRGNFIGTNSFGGAGLGNSRNGVRIETFSSWAIIGGDTLSPGTAPGNVISGNDGFGVVIDGSSSSTPTNTIVAGNVIGLRPTGASALRNEIGGVLILNAAGNVIGGATAMSRNVISGHDRDSSSDGIDINGGPSGNNVIAANYIGTNINGDTPIPNSGNGVFIHGGADNNRVGGTTAAERNVISGNSSNGIEIDGAGPMSSGNLVQRNYIGVKADGVSAMGNQGNGVFIRSFATNTTIGGDTQSAGNTIAFNGGAGIAIGSSILPNVLGTAVLSNLVHSNTGLGIDIGSNGVTPNDAGDTDAGANNLQNFPVLTSVKTNLGRTYIQGSLNSDHDSTFTLQFFSSPACDPAGNGEGADLLGSTIVNTDSSGNANFSADFIGQVNPSHVVTATATSQTNDTSEFSQCVAVCPFQFSPLGQFLTTAGGSVDININSVCNWTATTADSWITIVSEDTGSGNGTVSIEVRENFTLSARVGTINIGGLNYTVVQDGGLGEDCSVAISPLFQSFSASGGKGFISVIAEERCAWQALSSTSWVTFTGVNVGIGNGTVGYSVGPNTGFFGRNATITIGGQTFSVKQKAP